MDMRKGCAFIWDMDGTLFDSYPAIIPLVKRICAEFGAEYMLTGLKNRRGYEQILSELNGDEAIGTVFCDLNSLKEVNDNLGHETGDRLIQKFAGILKESFPQDHVYRISGDEFVVIVRNVDVVQFPAQMQAFADTLKKNDRIASFGFGIGKGNQAFKVVKEAEQMMYRHKDEYYLETGKQRRHVRMAAQERRINEAISTIIR